MRHLVFVLFLLVVLGSSPALAAPRGGAGEEVQFASATFLTTEASTAFLVQITVNCSPAASGTITVDWAVTAGGTATSGADFTATAGGTLQFDIGETSKSFEIEILPDNINEPDETVNLVLSNPTGGASLGAQFTAVLTIQDDGDPPPSVTLAVATLDVAEDAISAQLQVTLSSPSGYTVTVVVTTADGTAVNPDDYLPPLSPVSFPPGTTTANIGLFIVDDFRDELDETFTVTISAPGHATLGTITSCVVTILDDDPPPQVHFSATGIEVDEGAGTEVVAVFLDAASNLTVTVDYASTNLTAIAGQDYTALSGTLTFAPGETSKNISFTILDDAVAEGPEQFTITLSSPSNAALGTPATFTVTIRANSETTPAKKPKGGNCAAATGGGLAMLAPVTLALWLTRRRRRLKS